MMVAGTYDDNGGRPSGYMEKLRDAINDGMSAGSFCNGGYWTVLKNSILEEAIKDDDVIFWFPNVPNSKQKLVQEIKKRNPKSILITSKNNEEGNYSFLQLTAHALRNKANLFVEFKRKDEKILASVYDPLGNCYCKDEHRIGYVAKAMTDRIHFLLRMTRVGSEQVGEARPVPKEEKDFMEIVRNYADKFHDLIHGENSHPNDRLMGNCSFRCTLGGFPSFRTCYNGGMIFVSKRNLDKRDIGPDGFVAVEPTTMWDYLNGSIKVRYYGDHKPSVDTPIQLALYALYPNIRYMIHSHVYVAGPRPKMTKEVIPCGALEEVREFVEAEPYSGKKMCVVNLKGHGSIVAADDYRFLEHIPYQARKLPEVHE